MLHKTAIFILAYFTYATAFAQVDVTNYKNIVDEYLGSKFNKRLQGQYQFISFYSTTSEGGNWNFETDQLKDNTIDSFNAITFKYSFFSQRLHAELNFDVTIKKDSTFDNTVDLSCYIPLCVLQDTFCNLLTKDQAISIAKNNKIKYSVDFAIEFAKPINKKEYFWHIIGFNHKVDGTLENRNSYTFSGTQRMIINARTGDIVSYEDFNKDD